MFGTVSLGDMENCIKNKNGRLFGKRVIFEDSDVEINSSQLNSDSINELLVSKTLATSEFINRIKDVYEELHIDVEKRELANIVVSNLFSIEDEFEASFVNPYGITEFWNMMDMLSQSDTFMKLLDDTSDARNTFDMLYKLFAVDCEIKHDQFVDFYNMLIDNLKKPSLELIELTKEIERYIAQQNMSTMWTKYLDKIGLLVKYNLILRQ